MVWKNQILEGYICDVTSNGDGVMKIDNYPIFVPGGVTGDLLNITVTKTNKAYGFGRINKITEPSPHRAEPLCPVFPKCGGCDFMHIDYNHQLEIKAKSAIDNMQRIGSLHKGEYIFDGIIGADSIFNYRNKAQLPLGKRNGKIVAGFFAKGSHEIVPTKDCLIQDCRINNLTKLFLEYANRHKISVYDEKTHKGVLRHLYIRTGNKNDEILFAVVTNSKEPLPCENELVDILQTQYGLKGILQNINTQRTNLVLGDKFRVIWGDKSITTKISDLEFKVSSESFFQINGEQTEKLYQKALLYADLTPNDTVFDLYCGTGSISLFLARKAKKVIGVEIVEKAIENAKLNAMRNGIENAQFYAGDCADVTKRLMQNGEKADVVVVDPPRKGCSIEMLELIEEICPRRLVYVSCNSATLARDVKIMKEKGYALKRMCCVDMFPMSGHTECCALFCRA